MRKRSDIIRSHYIERVSNYSIPEHRVLDWASHKSQFTRFEVLINILKITKEGFNNKTLLDVGSGLGHLAKYIDGNNININYVGIDLISEMVERAKQTSFDNINPKFFVGDIFKDLDVLNGISFDYVYTSGIFNLNLGNNKKFFKNALKLFLNIANDVVCFNMLDASYSKSSDSDYFYSDKYEIVDITKKILSKSGIAYSSIKLVDNYLPNDFSIAIFLK